MASFIFSKLKSPIKPITPSKINIEIEDEDEDVDVDVDVDEDVIDIDDDDSVDDDSLDDVDDISPPHTQNPTNSKNSPPHTQNPTNSKNSPTPTRNMEDNLDDLNDACPCVGQLFDTLDEAEMFYRDYGRRIGFEVIIRTTHKRLKNKKICSRLYICRKGGRIASKSLDEGDVRKRKRNRDTLGRTSCKARMYVVHRETLKKWEVTLVRLEHNHEMVSPSMVHFMQRPRNITPIIRQLIITLNKSGIGPSKTLNVLGEITGGLENIGFTNQDIRNVLRDIRHYVFDSSDAQEGLTLLRELKCNSLGEFFYRVDVEM